MVWHVVTSKLKKEQKPFSGDLYLLSEADNGDRFYICSERDLEQEEDLGTVQYYAEMDRYKEVCNAANKLLDAIAEFTHTGLSSDDMASAISDSVDRLANALHEAGEAID